MKKALSILLCCAVGLFALSFASGAEARGFRTGEVAPESSCPNQTTPGLSAAAQTEVMLCMTNFARAVSGMPPIVASSQLAGAAEHKSGDILGCDEFSHEACGRAFTFWDQKAGYLKGCWKAAENIAWGTGTYSTVRAIMTAWLESPEHHANILGPYKEIGISVQVGNLEGNEEAAVWTQDFGSHKC
jgi:uncharacterized protein YkwD